MTDWLDEVKARLANTNADKWKSDSEPETEGSALILDGEGVPVGEFEFWPKNDHGFVVNAHKDMTRLVKAIEAQSAELKRIQEENEAWDAKWQEMLVKDAERESAFNQLRYKLELAVNTRRDDDPYKTIDRLREALVEERAQKIGLSDRLRWTVGAVHESWKFLTDAHEMDLLRKRARERLKEEHLI